MEEEVKKKKREGHRERDRQTWTVREKTDTQMKNQ